MNGSPKMTRRRWFGSSTILILGRPWFAPRAELSAKPPLMAPEEFERRLRGPIVSIPTPFSAEFEVDHAAVRRMIRRALARGIRIFDLTNGDGQFGSLSYEEIKQLTRTVVQAVGDDGIMIAGTGPWWTARVVEFARFVETIGASALQVLLPTGSSVDAGERHFRQIAQATALPIVLHGKYSRELLQKLAAIDSIVALKEDVSLPYFIDTEIHFGNRFECFSGGSYEWFLAGQEYGARAYFDTYATFAPEISARFWMAIKSNDVATQRDIVEKYDHPFIIEHFSHPFWHATLEYFGVAQRFLRPPCDSFTDEQMKEVEALFEKLDVTPDRPADAAQGGL
jgi:dihydrodipicolinate synthase/N-acetylneuraminate lyase